MGNQSNLLVLIVDDETEHQKNFSRWLERENVDVLLAFDGLNALGVLKKCLGERLPDCIILDVNMPRMDGFEFCKRIKEDSAYQLCHDIPILMLTARTSDETRDMAFEYGVDLFLRKTEIRDAKSLTRPVLNLCQKYRISKKASSDFELIRDEAGQKLKEAKITEMSNSLALTTLQMLPFPGYKEFAEMIHRSFKMKYGIEGAVYIRPSQTKPVFFTERSDLFANMINQFSTSALIPEKGVHHKRGYTIVISELIISLGVGYPSESFKKQILGEIVEQTHKIFEQYMQKKGVA
ncbi:MAG: response regulator [Deltaproteobacteria bacterium]|nr:response regulator [Deltaproteobacteria bacterium]MBT4642653.1 response regulator [Deltaproteobacteria bacterium]